VLAGDPEQSIYSFRGGSPLYFEETAADEDISLKESYRCPAPVANAAVQILDSNPNTDPRGFRGRSDDGELRTATIAEPGRLADAVLDSHRRADGNGDTPSVMLLTRTNSQLRSVSRALQSGGIPFDILGSRASIWDYGEMRAILRFLRAFPAADEYDTELVWKVTSNLPDGLLDGSVRGPRDGDTPGERVREVFATHDGPLDVVADLDLADWKRDALTAALKSPDDLSDRRREDRDDPHGERARSVERVPLRGSDGPDRRAVRTRRRRGRRRAPRLVRRVSPARPTS